MAISALSLPVDIPWKRLAISHDMYAASIDNPLPARWRPSLAVFYYEPEPTPELEKLDERTAFLKVVATVTGYQAEGAEMGAGLLSPEATVQVAKNFEDLFGTYYPALSALVQVAVFPAEGEWNLDSYPYLAEFEPKKREIVELVTDSGEVLTQSASNLNVRKGTTSTDRTEISDIDRGGSLGVNASVAKMFSFGVQGSNQQEVGTRSTLGTEALNVVTTDASKEKRESYSHTTTLSQLYHQLDSYHAGTNRALFYLTARPHFVDSPFTFVAGPRRLEGIQEFFLVVQRPRTMEAFCVKATLETGHLHESETTVTVGDTVYDQSQVSKTCSLLSPGTSGGGTTHKSGTWKLAIPSGYRLDRSRGGGEFTVTWQATAEGARPTPESVTRTYQLPAGTAIGQFSGNTAHDTYDQTVPQITPYDDHVDIRAEVYGWSAPPWEDSSGRLRFDVTAFTISEEPIETPTTTTQHAVDLFIVGREVVGCVGATHAPKARPPSVVFEVPLLRAREPLRRAKQAGADGAAAANAVSRIVRDAVIASHRASRRYEPGAVDFLHTRFALRSLLAGVPQTTPELLTRPLHAAEGLPAGITEKVRGAASSLTVGGALRLSPDALAQRAGLTPDEARKVLTHVLGVRYGRAHPTPGDPDQGGQGGGSGQLRRPRRPPR